MDNESSKYTLLTFTLDSDKIKPDTERKEFDHKPYNNYCEPGDLYLRKQKLWFIRMSGRVFAGGICVCDVNREFDHIYELYDNRVNS